MATTLMPNRTIRVPLFHMARASSCHAVVLALIALVAGCTPTIRHDVTLDPPLDNLAVQSPLPIKAGVYYSPEFSTFQYQRDFMSSVITVELGRASVGLFDRVLRASFKDVVRLDGIPAGISSKQVPVDVIVEPRIEAFHIRWGLEGDSEQQSVIYQVRFYDPHGSPIGTRFIRGKAVGFKPKPFETYAIQSSADLRNAAEKVPGALSEMWTSYQSAQAGQLGSTPIDAGRLEIQARRADNPFQVSPDIKLPLIESGIVAISVAVKNNGADPVQLRYHDFALQLPTGRVIPPASTLEILQPFERQTMTGEKAAMFGMAGLVASMQESAEQVDRRSARAGVLGEKGFRDRTLRAGETAETTVFFVPAYDVSAFSTANLLVWLVDPDGLRTTSSKAPVANLDYRPTQAVVARRQQSEAAAAVTASAAPAVSGEDTWTRLPTGEEVKTRVLTGEKLVNHLQSLGKVDVNTPSALMSLTFRGDNRFEILYWTNRNANGVRQEGTYSVRPGQNLVCFHLPDTGHATGGFGVGSEWISDCFRVSQTGEKTYSLKTLKGDYSFSYAVR